MVAPRSSDSSASQRARPQVYQLVEDLPPAPPLRGKVSVSSTVDDLIDALAADLVIHAENCVREFGDFHLALSGGSTPEPLYSRLMYDPNYRRLPWRRTHLWLVDERCVPFDHPKSNFRMIRELIGDHSDIPPEQLHPMYATADDVAEQYERELREALSWREKGQDRLDYALMGVGDDGHTASLFPYNSALHETERMILKIDDQAAEPPDRVTMTYNLLNAVRMIGVMVTGASKADAIARAARGDESVDALPIMGLDPLEGELHWYLDAAAAAGGSANGKANHG